MNEVQILLYTSYLHVIGGIETFVLNYIDLLGEEYSIGVYCPQTSPEMVELISQRAKLFTENEPISCDTIVMIRVMDTIPKNVKYKKSVRMCHACKTLPSWYVKDDCDDLVHVSDASRSSFKTKGDVIYNPLLKSRNKALMIVSATRIPAADKGKNAERMIKLAKLLNDEEIPFLWMNFSDAPLKNAPKGFVNVGTFHDLQPYIEKADYLVQLSDSEGFGYSVLEALISGTAVICTPFETTKELGVEDGKNGYIVPFDMKFDVKKLLKIPQFKYVWNNEKIKAQWEEMFGEPKDYPKYKPPKKVKIRAVKDYRDVQKSIMIHAGDTYYVSPERAEQIIKANYAERVK